MEIHSEQAKNSLSFQLLDICCKKVAEKVGNKPVSDWTNSDYVKLSGLLLHKTKIHLSENTLKRIFRKQKTSNYYYPQKATRDALAQFIGYRDWYEFEFVNPVSGNKEPSTNSTTQGSAEAIKSKVNNKTYIYITGYYKYCCDFLYRKEYWEG